MPNRRSAGAPGRGPLRASGSERASPVGASGLPGALRELGWEVPRNFLGLDEQASDFARARALVLPVPYLAVIVIAGSFLDPRLVAVVAGAAAALGELTGYLVGYTGRALLPKNRWYLLVERGVGRFGGPVIFLAAVIPNPFFDAVGIIAGALRLPLWVFLVACFLGKAIRFWLIASLGETLLP